MDIIDMHKYLCINIEHTEFILSNKPNKLYKHSIIYDILNNIRYGFVELGKNS